MDQEKPPAAPRSLEEEALRLERRRVGPEDEDRRSPDGPAAQVDPDIEPSGS